MKDLKAIREILVMHKEELKKRYGVREIGIFGSVVRGEHKKASDVDILVDFDVVPDLLEFVALERHLEEILGLKVDLVRKQVIRPELRDQILAEVVGA
ncbi:nucleotidyltransferase family protein [archaeon]|nr:nucleotidyltransferase family protein [archaeon]